jgi:hypothetical protein
MTVSENPEMDWWFCFESLGFVQRILLLMGFQLKTDRFITYLQMEEMLFQSQT